MTTETTYRPGLPPVPPRLQRRPIARGYPVPWFVAQLDDGSYDFRIADARKRVTAVMEQRCWICGDRIGSYKAFVIGPMCAINRTSAEPPAHTECALWSAQACPFLNQRESRRRAGDMPEGATLPPGEPILRQPGVALVWVTKQFWAWKTPDGGVLFRIGNPVSTHWYREGRSATRDEVLASIASGLPALWTMAEDEGPKAVQALEAARDRALMLIPA